VTDYARRQAQRELARIVALREEEQERNRLDRSFVLSPDCAACGAPLKGRRFHARNEKRLCGKCDQISDSEAT
jgi:predicted RNA-binding protein YlxR (DUF448 family)